MNETVTYYFIVNPASRSGRGKSLWHQLKPLLIRRNINYRVFFTTGADSARRYARHLTKNISAPIHIIVMGGDGTLNETVNGLTNTEYVHLGYIPTGSSNDFARAHNFDKAMENILDMILSSTSKPMDTGILQTEDNMRKSFIVSTGIGYDAAVTTECNISPVKKLLNKFHLGKLAYLLIGIKHIFTRKLEDMTVTIDDASPAVFKKVFFISVHNHPYEGGGFAFAPKANPSDGLLDICIIYGLNRLQLIPVLLASMKGNPPHFKGVQTYRCKSVSINSKTPQPVHADGESCQNHTYLKISCRPKTFKMLL